MHLSKITVRNFRQFGARASEMEVVKPACPDEDTGCRDGGAGRTGVSRRMAVGAMLGASFGWAFGHAVPASKSAFLSAARDADGNHCLAGFDKSGRISLRIGLPQRGHGPVVAPNLEFAVVPARRPGNWAAVVDLRTGRLMDWLRSSPGRHFYGHGVFSPDGERLYTTENDFEGGRGVVVCRSARTLEVLGEFESGGTGPHQLKWAGRNTLAVANGGILTHPSQPRRKLNLDRMRPNLALLDAVSGEPIVRAAPLHHQASVRHIDLAGNGDVALALQYEGAPTDDVPLVYVFRRDRGALEPLPVPLAVQRRMRRYTGSVCVDPGTDHALVTCPRGHLVTFWDIRGGGYLGHRRLRDAGGVTLDAASREFVVTNGGGFVFRFDTESFEFRRNATLRFPELRWDNHLAACPA